MNFFGGGKKTSLVDQRKNPSNDKAGTAPDFNFTHGVDREEDGEHAPLAEESNDPEVAAAEAEADLDLQIINPEDDLSEEDPRLAPADFPASDAATDLATPKFAEETHPMPEPINEPIRPLDVAPEERFSRPPVFSLDDLPPAPRTMETSAQPSAEFLNIKNLKEAVARAIEKIKADAEKRKTEIDRDTDSKVNEINAAATQAESGLAKIEQLL